MTSLATRVPATAAGSTLTETLDRLKLAEDQHLPDRVVALRDLAWTKKGHVGIPSLGEVRPNEWSRLQLSNLLGIKFDRWFEAATSEDRADEMTRRLRRAKGNVRLRLVKGQVIPTIRAVVSPGYTAIEDSVIMGLLTDELQGLKAHVQRLDVTERVTSVLIGVGQPQHVGGVVGLVWEPQCHEFERRLGRVIGKSFAL